MAGETEKPGNTAAPVAGSMLCCSVEDTGLGIEWGDLEHIFDAFYQTSHGKYVYEGTGLGLPISRNFVQMMGGELHVDSTPGCGSIFWFEIPIQVDKTNQVDIVDRVEPLPPHQATTPLPGQPAYRILVVEDEAYNRALLTRLLEMLGMEVRGALHGQEAIEYWKQWEPHIIFMDMRMPVMDGYEATRRIKALSKVKTPDAPLTPIVAITASVFMQDRDKIMAVGCDDFIQKPFQYSHICEILVKHLGVRFAEGAQRAEPHERAMQSTPSVLPLQDMVAAMPERWVLEMSYAASVADMRKVEQLIAELEEQHGMLAHELTRHVQDFRFDKIMALLEQGCQGSTMLHERVRETT
jgi:CheY-like chemotaxis protein